MMRYQAMLTTQGQWFKPNWRNYARWGLLQILPFYLIIRWQVNRRVSLIAIKDDFVMGKYMWLIFVGHHAPYY